LVIWYGETHPLRAEIDTYHAVVMVRKRRIAADTCFIEGFEHAIPNTTIGPRNISISYLNPVPIAVNTARSTGFPRPGVIDLTMK
jgi:hypothetical protein